VKLNDIATKLDGSGTPAMEGKAFSDLCNGPFKATLAISYAAFDEAERHVAAKKGAALTTLVIALAFLAGVLIIAVIGIVVVLRRFSRPVQVLMSAVERLTNRNFVEPVQAPKHPDELGKLSDALESLRLSAQEAERLEREAAERGAAELEKARLLQELCQAFDKQVKQSLVTIGESTDGLRKTALSPQEAALWAKDL